MTSAASAAIRETGTDKLLVEVTGPVAVVTFNNPAKRNALSREIRDALPGALAALQADPDVRVVVARGAGDKAFVSGADISEFGEQRTSPAARAEYDRGCPERGLCQPAGVREPSVPRYPIKMRLSFCSGAARWSRYFPVTLSH